MIGALRFAGWWHPALALTVALIAALATAWFYLRETRDLTPPYRYALPALRGTAIALTVFILAGPVWYRQKTIGTLGRVVFAIDQSASMSVTDSTASHTTIPSRLERAEELLLGGDTTNSVLAALQSTHAIEVIAFDHGPPRTIWANQNQTEIPLTFDLKAEGLATDIASSIAAIDDPDDDSIPATIVWLTDGQHNFRSSPIATLKKAQLNAHAIGFGSPDPPNDAGILRVEHPETASADLPMVGTLSLRHNQMTGQNVQVRIVHQEQTLWEETVTLDADRVSIPFEIDVQSLVERINAAAPRGVDRTMTVLDLNAVLDAGDGDQYQQNNTQSFRVAVSTSRNQLLVVDGSSRWEMRYIRNLFDRDPQWAVDTVLVGPGTDMPMLRRGDRSGQFPDTAQAISKYDAIVLGEVPAEQWQKQDSELVREFVARGGGLIVIDGRYNRLSNLIPNSLADVVPIQYLDGPLVSIKQFAPFQGISDHPLIDLWKDGTPPRDLWNKLPVPSLSVSTKPSIGAEVLIELETLDGSRVPWMVTRMFGAGRVVYLSSGQTWRWRYKVADRYHWQFWNQMMATVIQPPYLAGDSYIALGTDKLDYEVGQTATVRAQLRDSNGGPVSDSTVEALLVNNDRNPENRSVTRIPLEVDDPARGTYLGISGPLNQGAFSVQIRASGMNQATLQVTTPIWVQPIDAGEWNQVSLNEPLLERLAAAGGGRYLHESEADRIVEVLEELSDGRTIESDYLIWQSYYWFAAVIGLLTLEWWMRKRSGLI